MLTQTFLCTCSYPNQNLLLYFTPKICLILNEFNSTKRNKKNNFTKIVSLNRQKMRFLAETILFVFWCRVRLGCENVVEHVQCSTRKKY